MSDRARVLADVEALLRSAAVNDRPKFRQRAERFERVADRVHALALLDEWPKLRSEPSPRNRPSNGPGSARSARGAEPRSAPVSVAIDWSQARCFCACGALFALGEARPLTHFVVCPACCNPRNAVQVENLHRLSHGGLIATGAHVVAAPRYPLTVKLGGGSL
jgi:hypothetical protein